MLALSSCNTLVRKKHVSKRASESNPAGITVDDSFEPLSSLELLRHFPENLGEVEPGFLYRSDEPSETLLRFLKARTDLRYVFRLRGKPKDHQSKLANEVGVEIVPIRMSARRAINPRQVLEMIRLTHRARRDGGAILVHCAAGADRTGMMIALWRMLFQNERDVDKLVAETICFRHFPPSYPNVHRAIELARPELFRPFVEDPKLLDDENAVAELERQYAAAYPLASGENGSDEGPLRAGAARVDLLEGWQDPIQMATYGPMPGVAKGIRDPVSARALLLDNGARRIAIVSCDLLIMTTELREAVALRARERGLQLSEVLLAATHTHTSVGAFVDHAGFEFYMLGKFDPKMFEHLVERIVTSIESANSNLVDAKLGARTVETAGLQRNRRIGGTFDPEVGIIRVESVDGSPISTVVNFAGHPILSPKDEKISADYPGALARKLDESHGVGIFLGGALGTLNARAPSRPEAWVSEGLAETVAAELYRTVSRALPDITTQRDIRLGAMTSWVELPDSDVGIVPDLLFPIELALDALMDWPSRFPLQSFRIGDVGIIATTSEISARLGLEIKGRSPAKIPLVVTHVNGYSGYAFRRENHAKGKIDASSLVALNGPGHGPAVVEHALELAKSQWDAAESSDNVDLDPSDFDLEDPTLPQSTRPTSPITSSYPLIGRAQVRGRYLDDERGGQRLDGVKRDVIVTAVGPGMSKGYRMRLGLEAGYRRSSWKGGGARGKDEGPTDLLAKIEYPPLEIWSDRDAGHGLRLLSHLDVSAPTGNANTNAPYAFAVGSGVWRPAFGGALELTWNTSRTVSLETIYRTSVDDYRGRRPGDVWNGALRYSERHGCASIHLAALAEMRLKDRRTGGRTAADVRETSFSVGLAPGISFLLGDHLELFVEGQTPVVSSGNGARAGYGLSLGLLLGF